MKRVLRISAAAAIAVMAVLFVHRLWQRYACNLEEADTKRRVERLYLDPESIASHMAAHALVARVTGCIEIEPAGVGQYMLRAALFRILQRPDDAVADYRHALTIDRRAELYMNIGDAEMESGHQEEAVDAFTLAALTQWSFLAEIPEPQRDRVSAAVTPLRDAFFGGRPIPGMFHEFQERIVTGGKGPSHHPSGTAD
jgi:tetratricopeptide (TPR) repeat protein